MSRLAEDNSMGLIDSYHMFLSGGAGVGKSFIKIYH